MKKRFVSCLLALAMLSQGVLALAADETSTAQTETQQQALTITVENVEAEVDAKTVSVPIVISNNPGVMTMRVMIGYDSKALSISSVDVGDVTSDIEPGVIERNPYILLLNAPENVTDNGTIITVNFDIKDSAATGTYPITLSEGISVNWDEEEWYATLVDGSVKITRTVEPTIPDEEEPNVDESDADKPTTDEPDVDEPVIEKPIEPIFADTAGHWGVEYINKSVEYGLFKGSDDGKFNPDGHITRAQFITVLWRMAGSPDAEVTHSFTDTDDLSQEFKSAIAWGYAKGFVNGISDTQFDPNGSLTREAGMKMLHYYSGGQSGTEVMLYAIYDGLLNDSSEISSWARKSVYWGIYHTLISGTSEMTISPKAVMTRAQMAKIMVTYLEADHIQK